MTCQTTIRALLALILVPFAVCAHADNDLLRAIKYGATAKFTIRVINDESRPICGVKIEARFDAALNTSGELKSIITDTNGMAAVSGRTGTKGDKGGVLWHYR